jgi:hypothetical protein
LAKQQQQHRWQDPNQTIDNYNIVSAAGERIKPWHGCSYGFAHNEHGAVVLCVFFLFFFYVFRKTPSDE